MTDHNRSISEIGGDHGRSGFAARTSELMSVIYEELRRLAHYHMRCEPAGHTLQTTAIVHEAYLRLARQKGVEWQSPAHFHAIASQMIRRVLVDHARASQSTKRGGGRTRIALSDCAQHDETQPIDVLALDEALRELADLHQRQCRVVELRYFGGLSIEETAAALEVSPGTVKGDWRVARVWLKHRLESERMQ